MFSSFQAAFSRNGDETLLFRQLVNVFFDRSQTTDVSDKYYIYCLFPCVFTMRKFQNKRYVVEPSECIWFELNSKQSYQIALIWCPSACYAPRVCVV